MCEKCKALEDAKEGKNMVVDIRHDFLGVEVTGKDGKPVRLVLFDSSQMRAAMFMERIVGQMFRQAQENNGKEKR